MTTNPDTPEDAVELAQKAVDKALVDFGGLRPLCELVLSQAKAVLDMQERIDKLEAVNEHIERVNNTRYNQLRIAENKLIVVSADRRFDLRQKEAQVTALRTALEDLTEFAEQEFVKSYQGSDAVCHHPNCGEAGGHTKWCPIGMARETLSANPPPAVPDTGFNGPMGGFEGPQSAALDTTAIVQQVRNMLNDGWEAVGEDLTAVRAPHLSILQTLLDIHDKAQEGSGKS